jgi:predicted nucleic acid-binding protein
VIVVDASVLAVALADDGADGDVARERLAGEALAAPEIVDLEALSVFRRLVATGDLPVRRAALAVDDLASLPMTRAPHRPLLDRCWALRENVTPYDAVYVALAELLDCPLVTADARLSRAPGLHCAVELVTGPGN